MKEIKIGRVSKDRTKTLRHWEGDEYRIYAKDDDGLEGHVNTLWATRESAVAYSERYATGNTICTGIEEVAVEGKTFWECYFNVWD